MEKREKNIQPFLKWAGGKRQLLSEIRKLIPNQFNQYYEPFLGGGAVLFDLQPKNAVANDYNKQLINVYKCIKNHVNELLEELKKHPNEKHHYYKIREFDRHYNFITLPNISKAARIIYLNKTCYNGLFRVNSHGQFNVPFGRYKNPKIANEPVLKAVHEYLNTNNIKLLSQDFAESVKNAQAGDFVYFDPPYHPVSQTASFTGYTLDGFDENEQKRLKKVCDELNTKNVYFLLSNSATKFILDLYSNYKIETIGVRRNINSAADKRGKIQEVLVRNYE
jgi:DNA adenine methylase